nr:hypothetical protein [Tanacetum cinerariifolium]
MASYTPQQNGVAERNNRTSKEMMNSMLSYSGLKPNDYVSPNSIIESKDVIFDEERFTSIPRPRGMIQPSSSKIAEDEVEDTDDVPGLSVPRKSTRTRKAKSFGISTIRLLLALAAIHDLVIHQMDVKTAFLNGDLDEKIYMKHPEGFVMPGHESKEFLSSKFDMKDLGETEVILDIRIKRGNNGISISQSHYIEKILTEFNFANRSLVYTPVDPSQVFQYLKGTIDYGLTYSSYPSVIEGYSDASWINNMEDHSSTSVWVFLLGGAGNEAEWLSNLVYEIPL